MTYQLLVISRIETDTKDPLIALTLYPADTACIKPRPYETIVASFVQHFQPGIELNDSVSEKGKHRLKLLLRRPSFTDDERRALGTMFYSQLFGASPGNDEAKKGVANALYYAACDLYNADASTEEAWAVACTKAVATITRLVGQAAPQDG